MQRLPSLGEWASVLEQNQLPSTWDNSEVGRDLGRGTGKGWDRTKRWAQFTRIREVRPLWPSAQSEGAVRAGLAEVA